MKPDELAFANEQLAGMLKSGLPLEGSLRELTTSMKRGGLRTELEALERDLAQGAPLSNALDRRNLPPLYVRMLKVGVQSNNLPGVLQWIADYYGRTNTIWIRLKGLMTYPLLVLLAAVIMAVAVVWISGNAREGLVIGLLGPDEKLPTDTLPVQIMMWMPLIFLILLSVTAIAALALPGWRRKLRWQLPGFREAALSQVAASIAIQLRGGCSLGEALGLVRELEGSSPGGTELEEWSSRLARGQGKPVEFAKPGKVFPPLFTWTLNSGGEDLTTGFERAADMYHARAINRVETSLCVAWPVAIISVGCLVGTQVWGLFLPLIVLMDKLGQ